MRARLGAGIILLLRVLVLPLGWRGAQRLGAGLGRLAGRVARRDRRRGREHLAIAFPDLAPAARERLLGDCFAHLGAMAFECLQLLRMDCASLARRVVIEGWDAVERAREGGRPIIVLTGHCGNWELLAAAIGCGGVPLNAVARQQDDPELASLLVRLRARFGVRTLSRGSSTAARDLLRTLRAGGAVGLLIDQDTRVDGVWVPFFGRDAYTPIGAAQIARRQRVAVVPSFAERLDDGRHLLRFLPPLALPDDPVAATALMTRTIEEQVRRRPEQWVWMHRRWRRRPPEEAAPPPTQR